MAAIPQPTNATATAIYALHERRDAEAAPRAYLGWSEIGAECDRALWYGFRNAGRKAFEGRMLRLFQTGHLEEARVLQELRDIGCEVYDRDPATGEQFGVASHGGHFQGHLDAVVRGLPEAPKTWHLVDVKSIKAEKFDELLKKGMRSMYPRYWAQGQGYMGHQGLERAAFIFSCKDDDRIHVERFEFDRAEFEKYEARALRIITAEVPPLRLSDDPAWFECKFCDFHVICHGHAVPEVNCRTCARATPELGGENGRWTCTRFGEIGLQQQHVGCPSHIFIPGLLDRIAQPVDASADSVTYRMPDGREFVNGPPPGFRSIEIRAAEDKRILVDDEVQRLKGKYPTAQVVA